MKPVLLTKVVVALLFAAGSLHPSQASAQSPRFYWKTLSDTNAVPFIFNSLSGNTNPFDPSHFVTAGSKVDATLATTGYARTFSLLDRAAMAAFILPVGRISGELQVAGTAFNQLTDGFGDPMFEFDINVIGPRAQKSLPDVLRHEPGFSVDLLADVAVPIGRYDNTQPLNLGQNRWYGRVGAPMVLQLGPWVPGRRMTLEVLPAVWFFGPNDDFVGRTLKTDPLFQLDTHLTRNLTEAFWASLDVAWYVGGRSSVDGVAGKQLNNLGAGFTLGYAVHDNLNLTVGYKSTLFDDAPDELRLSGFMVSLVYGWHPLLEGVRRLKSQE
jgi:hypothetical protein